MMPAIQPKLAPPPPPPPVDIDDDSFDGSDMILEGEEPLTEADEVGFLDDNGMPLKFSSIDSELLRPAAVAQEVEPVAAEGPVVVETPVEASPRK